MAINPETHPSSLKAPSTPEDPNIVEMWLQRDTTRWKAGLAAGLFAGVIMLAFAGILAVVGGGEFWYPIKLAALPMLGNEATEIGLNLKNILTGFASMEILAGFLGVIYAHFTATNYLPALLGMGLVWGAFSWIFINNLFIQSVKAVYFAGHSRGGAFFVWMVFGLSLTSVAFFDRMLRGKN